MAARLREHYMNEGRTGPDQGVRLQERDGRPEDRQGVGQYRAGRGHAERQADGWRSELNWAPSRDRSRSLRKAKKSIAAFKLREGMPIGTMVTLRGDRMYEFLDRLLNVALPRVRDFRGVSTKSFDGRGNYTLGLQGPVDFPRDRLFQGGKDQGYEHLDNHHRANGRGSAFSVEGDGNAVPAVVNRLSVFS